MKEGENKNQINLINKLRANNNWIIINADIIKIKKVQNQNKTNQFVIVSKNCLHVSIDDGEWINKYGTNKTRMKMQEK